MCASRQRVEEMDEKEAESVVLLVAQAIGMPLGRSCRRMFAGGEIAGPERYW